MLAYSGNSMLAYSGNSMLAYSGKLVQTECQPIVEKNVSCYIEYKQNLELVNIQI